MAAVHRLPPDLLGQVLIRVQKLDIKILALVHKSWHEVVSLDSNPRVWGRLLMASGKPGVLVRAVQNRKVCILYLPFCIIYNSSIVHPLEPEMKQSWYSLALHTPNVYRVCTAAHIITTTIVITALTGIITNTQPKDVKAV
jgi:hypothetical protein